MTLAVNKTNNLNSIGNLDKNNPYRCRVSLSFDFYATGKSEESVRDELEELSGDELWKKSFELNGQIDTKIEDIEQINISDN